MEMEEEESELMRLDVISKDHFRFAQRVDADKFPRHNRGRSPILLPKARRKRDTDEKSWAAMVKIKRRSVIGEQWLVVADRWSLGGHQLLLLLLVVSQMRPSDHFQHAHADGSGKNAQLFHDHNQTMRPYFQRIGSTLILCRI